MLSEGEGRAGGGIAWDGRLEVVLEVRRGDGAMGRGDGGTELRSGAMIAAECAVHESIDDVV